MRRFTILSVALAALALSAGAQSLPNAQTSASASSNTAVSANRSGAQASTNADASTSAEAGQQSASLADGTTMQAELTHPVDCKKNKAGDAVTAKTTQAVTSNGQVMIPKGSRLIGHVTEARQHEKRQKGKKEQPSALGIAWDKAVLKNGKQIPLNASIQAIASAQSQAATTIDATDAAAGGGTVVSGGGSGRGALGGIAGVGSAASGTVGAATRPVSGVGNGASGAINSTASAAGSTANVAGSSVATTGGTIGGIDASGRFVSNSRGVFGLNGLSLSSLVSDSAQGSLITSNVQNVHLDSGTRMLLVAQGQTQRQGHETKRARKKADGKSSGSRPQSPDQQP